MQHIENQVWRQMLGAPRFTPVVALHGEIGASRMKCSDVKSKLKMVKHVKTTENGLLYTKHPVCLISSYLDQEGAPGSSEN